MCKEKVFRYNLLGKRQIMRMRIWDPAKIKCFKKPLQIQILKTVENSKFVKNVTNL